jgi:hypothetical protein
MTNIDTSAEAVERLAALTFNVQTRLKDREQFVMSIPARLDHDMDLILANAAATLRALAAERDALREALSALLDACELRANREGGDFGPEIGPAAERAAAALRAMAEEAGDE